MAAKRKRKNMWLKAISGHESLYGVQYAYRRPLGPELAVPIMRHLRRVAVCHSRRLDQACLRGM